MLKCIKNQKGFTLIELLAVIVILGILMIIAIPAVTKYINNSRKDAFADNAGAYINAARYALINDEYDCQAPGENGQTVYIPLILGNTLSMSYNIELDKGSNKSSYNQAYRNTSYVKATYDQGKLVYSICLVDNKNNFIPETLESELSRNKVKVGYTSASCTIPTNNATTCIKK